MAFIANLPGVRVAPVLAGQAILTFAGKEQGLMLSGIVPGMDRLFASAPVLIIAMLAISGLVLWGVLRRSR